MSRSLREDIQKLWSLEKGTPEKQEHPVYVPIKRQKKENNFQLTKQILWQLFNHYAPHKYVIDERNQEIIFTVLRYFLRDENFNQYKKVINSPDLEKGLLIFGSYGVGKSQLFEILRAAGKELVVKVNCTDVWFSQISAGSFVDEYMRATKEDTIFSLDNYYNGRLYIDDLGFEKKAFNKTELFGELLFERNRRKSVTFVTTNLNPSELTEKYGERIGDRLPEMFNILKWEGESFRE